jgi:LmbE family N-acetylglucosaminyl deacetylase
MLLLGVYGMELVECGGALLKNVRDGGVSHASMLFCGERMQRDLAKSSEILGTTVEYLDMDIGAVTGSREERLKIAAVIRRFRPDIIITQDPEHCVSDFDPGRRPVMNMILEGIALAGRNYAVEECGGYEPHGHAAIYYMSPQNPNCLVDIFDVWEEKCAAMDCLQSQLEFSGTFYERTSPERMRKLVPGWDKLETTLERGTAAKRVFDQAYYLYHGSTGHNDVLFSEAYRRDGLFILENLQK